MTDSAAAERPASTPVARRALLGAGLTGAALALAASRSASASGLSAQDTSLLEAAMQFELSARDLYDESIAAGADDFWGTVRELHESYAQLIAGIVGESASTHNATVFDKMKGGFGAEPSAAAIELEQAAAATHIAALADLESADAVAALASIAATEARLATVITAQTGDDDLDALLTSSAQPIDLGAGS